MNKPLYSINDIAAFYLCPLKLSLLKEENNEFLYYLGDENILLGSVLKKSFTYYASSRATKRNVNYKTVFSKFSTLWTEHRHKYSQYQGTALPDIIALSNVYDKISLFKDYISSYSDIAVVNMPYVKSFDSFNVSDNIDLILVNKLNSYTSVEILLVDNDLAIPSRTFFINRIKAAMQMSYVRRELAAQTNDISISTLNLFHAKKTPISFTMKHVRKYKRALNQICNSISNGIDYPIPSKYNCSKCVFNTKCPWADKK